MLNIGAAEIVVIAFLALIMVGPQQLPGLVHKIGKASGQVRSMGQPRELRTKLGRSVVAVVVSVVAVWFLLGWRLATLEVSYCEYYSQVNGGSECKFLLLDPFLFAGWGRLIGASWGGLIFALPVVLYQLARFVMPGLYPNERKVLLAFVPMSVVLTFAGVVTAYFFAPKAIDMPLAFGPGMFDALISPSKYFQFFVKMLLAFGLAFQLPVVLIFLQKVGLLRPESLKKNRRPAAVVVVVAGAVITPTVDPFTLAVISVLMYTFYEISILVGSHMKFKQTTGSSVGEASAYAR